MVEGEDGGGGEGNARARLGNRLRRELQSPEEGEVKARARLRNRLKRELQRPEVGKGKARARLRKNTKQNRKTKKKVSAPLGVSKSPDSR